MQGEQGGGKRKGARVEATLARHTPAVGLQEEQRGCQPRRRPSRAGPGRPARRTLGAGYEGESGGEAAGADTAHRVAVSDSKHKLWGPPGTEQRGRSERGKRIEAVTAGAGHMPVHAYLTCSWCWFSAALSAAWVSCRRAGSPRRRSSPLQLSPASGCRCPVRARRQSCALTHRARARPRQAELSLKSRPEFSQPGADP